MYNDRFIRMLPRLMAIYTGCAATVATLSVLTDDWTSVVMWGGTVPLGLRLTRASREFERATRPGTSIACCKTDEIIEVSTRSPKFG